MDEQKAITVNIVNRNYPPHAGITGESAAELASYLLERGIVVNIIHVDAVYRKEGTPQQPVGNSYKIKTFYNGKIKMIRLLSNLYEGVALLRKSQSLGPDLTICMTEPPLLSVCAAMLFTRKDKWVLWSMDLFPEALAAGKIISKANCLYRFLDYIVKNNKPHHVIGLGNFQINYMRQKFGSKMTFTKLPCGIFKLETMGASGPIPSWAMAPSKIILGYCGNLGEAHSYEFIISVIKNLDPEKHKFILAPYGSKAKKVLDFATGRSGVEIVTFVKKCELKYIDVHLASLKQDWVNVCVPSKTVSSVSSGSAFLYFGSEESDNWDLLKDAGWLLPPETDFNQSVKEFFEQLDSTIGEKKLAAFRLIPQLQQIKQDAFLSIYRHIVQFGASK